MKAHSTMGTCRTRKGYGKKIHKGSEKGKGRARIYRAYPPEGGWPGGEPEKNGYKP